MSLSERTTASANSAEHINLIHLPVEERSRLSSILDQNEFWTDLGKLMQFSDFEISVRIQF